MKEIIKLYLIQILKIALGVLLIYYLLQSVNIRKSGILLISIVMLMMYLAYISLLLMNGKKEDWNRPFQIWEAVIMLTGFFIGLLEIGNSYFKVLNFSSLFWQSIMAGIAFGILIQIIRSKTGNNDKSWAKIAGILIGYALFGFVVASIINKTYANEHKERIQVAVLEKSEKKSEKDSQYFVKIKLPKEEKQIKISKEKWEKIIPGNQLALITKKGFLGYRIIDDVKINNTQ